MYNMIFLKVLESHFKSEAFFIISVGPSVDLEMLELYSRFLIFGILIDITTRYNVINEESL